jgi:hypothetical protein
MANESMAQQASAAHKERLFRTGFLRNLLFSFFFVIPSSISHTIFFPARFSEMAQSRISALSHF